MILVTENYCPSTDLIVWNGGLVLHGKFKSQPVKIVIFSSIAKLKWIKVFYIKTNFNVKKMLSI